MKNVIRNIAILIFIVLAGTGKTTGQAITVNTWLDTTVILLGDQIKYHIEVEQDRSLFVNFPLYGDTIIDKVEILERSQLDTLFITDKLMKISQDFLITSFDSGLYVIPPQKFAFSNGQFTDTIESQAKYLGVLTFQIDSVQGIADIKPPIDTPITFMEALPTGLYILGGLLLIAIIIILIRRLKGGEAKPILVRSKPKPPADFTALSSLDELKKKKLWQRGKHKIYQSELTDIVRTYIEERYQVIAMEQTSDETLETIASTGLLNQELFEKLKKMLTLADLVKFAKMEPLPDEHERSMTDAYDFVLKTKLKVDLSSAKPDEEKTDLNNDNNQSDNKSL